MIVSCLFDGVYRFMKDNLVTIVTLVRFTAWVWGFSIIKHRCVVPVLA